VLGLCIPLLHSTVTVARQDTSTHQQLTGHRCTGHRWAEKEWLINSMGRGIDLDHCALQMLLLQQLQDAAPHTCHTSWHPCLVLQVYLALCIVSFAFPALATITKEHIFKEAAKSLGGGQQLDVLVVNAFCSTAQVSQQ
jgi:hypothetical protein